MSSTDLVKKSVEKSVKSRMSWIGSANPAFNMLISALSDLLIQHQVLQMKPVNSSVYSEVVGNLESDIQEYGNRLQLDPEAIKGVIAENKDRIALTFQRE